jgi:hypothetical protein
MKNVTKIVIGIMALIGVSLGGFFIASAIKLSVDKKATAPTAPTYSYPTAADASSTPQVIAPEASQTPAPLLSATLSELTGTVQVLQPAEEAFSSAANGQILQVGGHVQTAADGRARLDLSSGTIVRVSPSTLFTLVDNQQSGEEDLLTRLKLDIGQIFIILTGGRLDVETPSGVASVRGSYLMVQVLATGGVKITCLEGVCELAGLAGSATLTTGQSAVISDDGSLPVVSRITEAEVREWLGVNPEATVVIPLLITSPTPGSLTPTITPTLTPTRTRTATPTSGQSGAPVQHCNNVLYPIRAGQSWLYEFYARGTSHLINMSVASVSGRQGMVSVKDSSTGLSSQATVSCESGEIRNFPMLTFARLLDPASTINMTYSSGVLAPSQAGFEAYNWWTSWSGQYIVTGSSSVRWQGVNYAVVFNNAPMRLNCQTTGAGSAAFQSITVPAGTFNALKVVCGLETQATVTVDSNTVNGTVYAQITQWFAPGVGMLRSQVESAYVQVLGLTFPLNAASSVDLLEYKIP